MSDEIETGTLMIHPDGHCVVIDRRKPDGSGWWNTDGSGLADAAIKTQGWTPVSKAERRVLRDIVLVIKAP